MQKIYKYKQNKKEPSRVVRERTKIRFTIQSIENNIAKLKSHNTSVTWYEYASEDEIEETKLITA